jgi:DNA-binding transcriptional regulator YdaS (Cro superfamily)
MAVCFDGLRIYGICKNASENSPLKIIDAVFLSCDKGVMSNGPFAIVVDKIGSRAALARLLGRPESTVKYWAKTGIPAEDAIVLEMVSEGIVPRWMARPDLWDAPTEAK